ncbi:Cytochrome P450 4c3 [Eumeta japonica]|uniref:Cytochrome P450 4c3 n=1 Tax=Eumeta variegata TaxID=151549 RepID=A0A4C1V3T9_EUMVA|nr:Cytochrome P450 4c3 [Eumeta japonica]
MTQCQGYQDEPCCTEVLIPLQRTSGGWTIFVLYSWEQHEQKKKTKLLHKKRRLEKAKLKRQEKIANESDVHKRQRLEKISIDCTVSIWRPRRKIMAPTFSPRILEQFVEIFAEQSDILSRRLAAQSDGAPLSAWPLISAYTLDSVCGKYGVALTLMQNT